MGVLWERRRQRAPSSSIGEHALIVVQPSSGLRSIRSAKSTKDVVEAVCELLEGRLVRIGAASGRWPLTSTTGFGVARCAMN